MTQVILVRTALFVAFVLVWALLAAAMAQAGPRDVREQDRMTAIGAPAIVEE
jgi:hypothetical protein